MAEQNRGEGEPTLEEIEEMKRREFMAAEEEEYQVAREQNAGLDELKAQIKDEGELRRIVEERGYVGKIVAAMEKKTRAFEAWQKARTETKAAFERAMSYH